MGQTAGEQANLDEVVEVAKAVGDHLRASILRVLSDGSYSVTELCHLFQIPQPALSHHLKVLLLANLVARRREGNNVYYRRCTEPDDGLRQRLFETVDGTPLGAGLAERAAEIHAERSQRSNAFFAENAHRFADQQALICEAQVYIPAIVELLDHAGVDSGPIIEVGPGGGQLLATLAGSFDDLTGIDSSSTMLAQAAERLDGLPNVKLRQKDFTELPAIRRYRAVIAAMVVHHLASPQRFFRHAARILRHGGLLIVAELDRHEQEWVTDACGDLWLGFEPGELEQWAAQAGLVPVESQFLAQKNGFQIQIHGYASNAK